MNKHAILPPALMVILVGEGNGPAYSTIASAESYNLESQLGLPVHSLTAALGVAPGISISR